MFVPNMEKERGLTEDGIEQSKRILDILSCENIDLFFSSPYTRAIETIRGLANRYNEGIVINDCFRERDIGIIPNNEFYEAKKKLYDDFDFSFPEGESSDQAQRRAINCLNVLLNMHMGKKIVIGTHGDIMTLMINYFDHKCGYDFWRNLSMPDIYRIAINEKEVFIDRLWC